MRWLCRRSFQQTFADVHDLLTGDLLKSVHIDRLRDDVHQHAYPRDEVGELYNEVRMKSP
jgi:hypothetical protein